MTDEAITIMAKAIASNMGPISSAFIAEKHAVAALEALRAAGYWVERWRPIEEATKDGTVIDVWLGDADKQDVDFYCTPGTRRSSGWSWKAGKLRPLGGLPQVLTTFVQPTHFTPPSPASRANGRGWRMTHAGNQNNLFTPRSLSEAWGCSERHVRNLIARGELASFRIGPKLIRIRGEAVEAYECRAANHIPSDATAEHSHSLSSTPEDRAADIRLARMTRESLRSRRKASMPT